MFYIFLMVSFFKKIKVKYIDGERRRNKWDFKMKNIVYVENQNFVSVRRL